MKWFKHMTDASLDENIVAIRNKYGREGVCRYWEILELIASKMDDSDRCEVTYLAGYITRYLGFRSVNDCRLFLEWLANDRQMIGVRSAIDQPSMGHRSALDQPSNSHLTANEWTLRCDKLLKIRARKKPIGSKTCHTEVEVEVEVDKDIKTHVKLDSKPAPNGAAVSSDIHEIFDAYCKSWARDLSKYKLTDQRRRWIKNALSSYGKDRVLDGIAKFRKDPWEDRVKHNDIKYLFGDQLKIDKWCGVDSKKNKAPAYIFDPLATKGSVK